MNTNQQKHNATKCANCGLAYQLTGTKPPCPSGSNGPAGWSREMLVFMRCTAAATRVDAVAKQPGKK